MPEPVPTDPTDAQALNAHALLTVAETYKADAAAEAAGVASLDLMEAAGRAVAREVIAGWAPQPVAMLCGPGNNGGDGFVAARHLAEAGWPVRVFLLGERGRLKGDAAVNAERWRGEVATLDGRLPADCRLVVDALFGAGLGRALEGTALAAVEAINERRLDCVAVDVPSGVHGDSGQVLGAAARASATVTFFRRKPAHLLAPGRSLAGRVVVADIGIPDSVLAAIGPRAFTNHPDLWLARYPWPRPEDNKYSRGHAVIWGGAEMTGAARLAARGSRRVGAGLVPIAAPAGAFLVYASDWPGTLVRAIAGDADFDAYIADPRRNAVLIGPGAGVTATTRKRVLAALERGKACVLDADALTVFQDRPEALFGAHLPPRLFTPHEGEFRRLFADDGDKLVRARAAARRSGAVILLKGWDTVIAAPDGRCVINANAPAELATGGSGDVLAGFALGLMAQGMDVFQAASAAVWLHGEAARAIGPGLIAEDLPEAVPAILARLRQGAEQRHDGAGLNRSSRKPNS